MRDSSRRLSRPPTDQIPHIAALLENQHRSFCADPVIVPDNEQFQRFSRDFSRSANPLRFEPNGQELTRFCCSRSDLCSVRWERRKKRESIEGVPHGENDVLPPIE